MLFQPLTTLSKFFGRLTSGRLLTLVVGVLLVASCSKPPVQSKEDQIQRRWTYKEGDQVKFLTLKTNPNNKVKEFTTNIGSLPDSSGTWELVGDTVLVLHGRPSPTIQRVDSTVNIKKNSSVEIIQYGQGREIEYLTRQGGTYKIAKISDKQLSLEGDVKIAFKYVPEQIESNFSITSILRGLLGIMVLLVIAWLASANRRRVDWALVAKGIGFQLVIALLVLKVPIVADFFDFVSKIFIKVIDFTQKGTEFLFANFDSRVIEEPLVNFAITILPTVIFFSALTSLFYYWGILQKLVWVFATVMKKIMKLSGAESMAAAGNIFLGQTEAPLLVKPYLLGMTKSEIMCLMSGGMATIAGGVLAAYISFLGGGDPQQELYFAKHLLTASIMSAPAAIVAAKIILPETEEFNEELKIPKDKIGANELEAIANGTTDGLKLAVNVGAMLLVFTALVALANYVLTWIGGWTTLNETIAANTEYSSLSFDFILGYVGAPLVWLMGVSADDMVMVGELLGKKTMINEFVAYPRLGEMQEQGVLSQKSVMMATYMLCGFANIASIGIQIGGIGSLIPSRKGLLSKLGFRALIAGTIACLMTAVMVGMLM